MAADFPYVPGAGCAGGLFPWLRADKQRLSLETNKEGRKAEAGVFFRKEIFTAVTVWESWLSSAVRLSQEVPPPTVLTGQKQTLLRTGRGEVR